jgi:hypothetical protein
MSDTSDVWQDDLLGFKSRGDAFTNLVTSITDHRTISIEAGYGRGKTFFRERWAKQLRAAGECVVEIDARMSDYSGDPVVTFLGALLELVPESDTKKFKKVVSAGKKILMSGGKAVGKAALREGFDELSGVFAAEDGEATLVGDIAKAAGSELSKAAGALIATQLTAEKVRKEMGTQLKTLHAEITKGRGTDRIVILIDELDRCHPDYAIALLEAMKLVFDQNGFVFVLMVNREYLEKVAAHRFGKLKDGEFYLDKFVDLRLKLEAEKESLTNAVETLASQLPLAIPFGDHAEFSVERAAMLAGELAPVSGLSFRQIERVLSRVELALRIYKDRPIDAPLLVWIAFNDSAAVAANGLTLTSLSRAKLTPIYGAGRLKQWHDLSSISRGWDDDAEKMLNDINSELENEFSLLIVYGDLSNSVSEIRRPIEDWQRVYQHLAPHYIPDHQAMLDAVHELQVDP